MTANTVCMTMTDCGLLDDNKFLLGESESERFANEIFDYEFETCMNKSNEDLREDFRSFSELTVGNGRICVTAGIKRNVKAFIYWTCHCICLGIDPSTIPFPVANVSTWIRVGKPHDKFVIDAQANAKAMKPKTLTPTTNFKDWVPTFDAYLKQIPGRNGTPLNYIIQEQVIPTGVITNNIFIDYATNSPHGGNAYSLDNNQVGMHIMTFIVGNTALEARVQSLLTQTNGFKMWLTKFIAVLVFIARMLMLRKIFLIIYFIQVKKSHLCGGINLSKISFWPLRRSISVKDAKFILKNKSCVY